MADPARLRQLLGAPGLAWLLERLRRRLEQGEGLAGSVRLRDPTPGQREAVGRLFGTRGGGGARLEVDLGDLERLLVGAGICRGLPEAAEELLGPVRDRKAGRERDAAQWSRLFDELGAASPAPVASRFLDDVRAMGLLKRLSGGDPRQARLLAERALRLAERLPASQLPLAELAAAVAGDAHALDPGEPLGTLAQQLLARLLGSRAAEGAEGRREHWARAGVLCDELSAPLLVLNLPAAGETLSARALRLHAAAGEPYRLSTRQLAREPVRLTAPRAPVHVCENATVLAAAANRLGSRCAPLLCVEGMPKTAARLLLRQLTAAGAELRYHGDFDWGGVRIANLLVAEHGARPWRMAAQDYRDAASRGSRLAGEPTAARWDPDLAPAMRELGRAVHEEQVLSALLDDLG